VARELLGEGLRDEKTSERVCASGGVSGDVGGGVAILLVVCGGVEVV